MTPTPHLKAAALAATPGPWHSPGLGEVHAEDHRTIVDVCWLHPNADDEDDIGCGTQADADYIALANPATILALIERLQVAEDAAKDAELLRSLIDENNPVDVIYFDNGEIIDVGGKSSGDLRKAIAARRLTL